MKEPMNNLSSPKEFIKRQVGDAYQYFPEKFRKAEIFDFMRLYAAQFKSPSPVQELDFDGPLAMVDFYQRQSRHWENEAAKWANKFRALKEEVGEREGLPLTFWKRLYSFMENVEVSDLPGEEEKQMILSVARKGSVLGEKEKKD